MGHVIKRDRAKLSERQRNILEFIEQFIGENGYPPTIRDIGKAFNIGSTSVVNYNLNKLVREGYLERAPNVSRGLMLVKEDEEATVRPYTITRNAIWVPLSGQIVASEPLEAFELPQDEDELIEVPQSIVANHPPERIYALRVKGHSMIDAMVADGDIVVMRQQETAQDRDMVAVWLKGTNETTLKYFFHEGKRIRLQPANPLMEPIYVDVNQVQVQGRVLGILRVL
ncbi:MAG: transcriptional repressor LexA [Anaerolineae bacterium]|nr:transcriptional repressor LexA [Anaerolineae bacterium]